jgi:hypothetical protein
MSYNYLWPVARSLQQLPALQEFILNPNPGATASHRKQKKEKKEIQR